MPVGIIQRRFVAGFTRSPVGGVRLLRPGADWYWVVIRIYTVLYQIFAFPQGPTLSLPLATIRLTGKESVNGQNSAQRGEISA